MGKDATLRESAVRDAQPSHEARQQGPPPYHLFKCHDEHFVYDTSSCRFFHIDPLTHDFLDLCHTHAIADAQGALLLRNGHSPEEIASVAAEVQIMADHGLFDTPDYTISDDEVERQLEQRYDAPWNKLELALAETCNLACTYCYCRNCRDTPEQGLMSETVARQAITWLFAMSGRSKEVHITFFGGEPLLNKPVLRFAIEYSQRLARLHGKKVHYSMTTNGTLLDDEVIRYIKRYNFGLMVSLDGPPEIHNAQRPTRDGQGSFEMAAAGIKKLMARRKRVTVRCTMTKNAPPMRDLIDFFEDFGFTRIVMGKTVNPVNPSPVDCTDADFERFEKEGDGLLDGMLEQLKTGTTPAYYPYAGLLRSQNGSRTEPFRPSAVKCGACRGTTTVGSDGLLYPCHRFTGMKNWVIGRIEDGPDIELCRKFWRDYHRAIRTDCDSCWARPVCKGPCPWEIAEADGAFCLINKNRCAALDSHFQKAAWLHHQVQSLKLQCGKRDRKVFDSNEEHKRDA